MDPAEPAFRGAVVLYSREWLTAKAGGPDAFERLLPETPPSFQSVYGSDNILPAAWYPAQAYADLYYVIATRWGVHAFEEGAAHTAERDLSAAMRFFLMLGSPSMVAGSLGTVWSHYFNRGKLESFAEKNEARLVLRNATVYGLGGCHATIGWSSMALRRAGAKNVKALHYECALAAASACTIELTWD